MEVKNENKYSSRRNYKKRNSVRAYEVDVGIGLSHFHQTTLENGLSGKFEKLPQDNIDAPENTN